jgi:glucose/arabinose dehydrogenase
MAFTLSACRDHGYNARRHSKRSVRVVWADFGEGIVPVHGRLRGRRAPVCVLLLALLLAAPLQARRGSALEHAPGFPPAPLTVSLELVARGIPGPVFVTHAGDGSGRLFVNEQVGRVRVVVDGEPLAEPFLDIRDLVRAELSEQGLLGLAFHPDYATNGLFFVAFTGRDDTNTVVRFQVSADDPNRADPTSGLVVLAIPDRFPEHHKGGMLAFGPDGYLYISTGDEGFTYDEVGNS